MRYITDLADETPWWSLDYTGHLLPTAFSAWTMPGHDATAHNTEPPPGDEPFRPRRWSDALTDRIARRGGL